MAILAVAALAPSVPFAHWPISWPALKLSVANRASAASAGSSGVSSVMTRMPASRAFLTVGTMAVEVARHQQDALRACSDQLLDRLDFAVVVAVRLAGVGLRRQAEFLGLGLKTFLHLDEERVGVGLGDEADDFARRKGRSAGQRERHSGGRCGFEQSKFDRHDFLPECKFPTAPCSCKDPHGVSTFCASGSPVVGKHWGRVLIDCQG